MEQKNYNNEERRIGFEIEYEGLSLVKSSEVIQNLLGGEIRHNNNATSQVKNTELGDFTIELDAIPLQNLIESTSNFEIKNYEKSKEIKELKNKIRKSVQDTGAKIIPYEIVSPPVKISQIYKLDELCEKLRELGAKGTRTSLKNAFGLHINPEVSSLEVSYIIRHLQSFLLLSPWLKQKHKINITRRLTSFIDPFPQSYCDLILDRKYNPNFEQLVKDYHQHNPSRNRALDMLPLFLFIDEELVIDLYGDEEKINKRPTFHYRLPNCEIGQLDWSIDKEWKIWCVLESLAGNKAALSNLIDRWNKYNKQIFKTEAKWIEQVDKIIIGLND